VKKEKKASRCIIPLRSKVGVNVSTNIARASLFRGKMANKRLNGNTASIRYNVAVVYLSHSVLKELGEWTSATRQRAAFLLEMIVLFAEDDITQFVPKILDHLYAACRYFWIVNL
jgi:hypothetical protein